MERVIHLLDSTMCTDCRFNKPELLPTDMPSLKIYCTRRDCDNFKLRELTPIQSQYYDKYPKIPEEENDGG